MIVFAHLLNDRSGSPRVLHSVISILGKDPHQARLVIGSDGAGILSSVQIPVFRYWYKRTPVRLLTLVTFMTSQVLLFFRLMLMRDLPRHAVIYVNTLLPFGAALFGKLTARPVIYHLHEVSISPAPLQWMLVFFAKRTASQLIYVSEFHQRCLPMANIPFKVVHNANDATLILRASTHTYQARPNGQFNVVMLSALRQYKGVDQFVELARLLASDTSIALHLVANDEDDEIVRYFKNVQLPANLTVHPRTKDPCSFYEKASLVMNLSRPDQCQETFGLTLLEAMSFGMPVIAPPVGGPAELVQDGVQGYLIDSRDTAALCNKVQALANDAALCEQFSVAARHRSQQFTPDAFSAQMAGIMAERGWA
jgi:L-malate glycosyltransferase